jgi:hypothetical protein
MVASKPFGRVLPSRPPETYMSRGALSEDGEYFLMKMMKLFPIFTYVGLY